MEGGGRYVGFARLPTLMQGAPSCTFRYSAATADANRLQREDLMLIVFGGLPGTGKTTISRAVAIRRFATYLRVDAIEQAIRNAGVLAGGVGTAGYRVANTLAETNLAAGRTVVVDGVHPVAECREAWKAIASRVETRLIEVEIVCSDPLEHRRRVEGRISDIRGLIPPTWQAVLERDYEPWQEPHLIIDTARLSLDQAISAVESHIGESVV